MFTNADRNAPLSPWRVVLSMGADLVGLSLLTLLAATHAFGSFIEVILTVTMIYLAACLGITSAVAALQVGHDRTQIEVHWFLVAPVAVFQVMLVIFVWSGYGLLSLLSTGLLWLVLLSAPAVALVHLALARRR